MKLFRTLAVPVFALLLPTLAPAEAMDVFTLTGNGLRLSFTSAASPKPSDSDPTLGFFLDSLKVTANGKNYTASPADFFIGDVGGGFALQDDADLIEYFSFSGPQLFSGSVRTPTFLTGNFSVQPIFCPGSDPDNPSYNCTLPTYNLNIAAQAVATPEPGTLALLGTGLLSGIPVLRRRIRREAASHAPVSA